MLDLMRQRIVEGLKYLCGRKRGYLTGCPDWEYAKGCRQVGAFLWLRPRDGETVLAVDEGMGQANGQEEEMAIGQEEKTAAVEVEGTLVAQEDEAAVGEGQQTMQGRSSTVAPGEFATLDMDRVKKSKVPVHNLQLLLGDTYIKDLRRHLPQIFDYEVVALKDRRATIDVQLRLWKLQGYLAEHKQLSDE